MPRFASGAPSTDISLRAFLGRSMGTGTRVGTPIHQRYAPMFSTCSKMQPTNWPRLEEPFHRTLARNVTIAIVVAGMVALMKHDLSVFLPVAALALWPSLGG